MNAIRSPFPGEVRTGLRPAAQSGFTLIELMISVTIGLLLVAAMAALFLNISRGNREMAKTNIQIENGRFAIQLLHSDIVHAGFWGSFVPEFDDLSLATTKTPADVPSAIPDPCLAYSTLNWTDQYKKNLIGIVAQSYEIGAMLPAVLMPGTTCDDLDPKLVLNPQLSTDILFTRHAETCVPGVGNCEVEAVGKLYFQSSLCEMELNPPLPLPPLPPFTPIPYVLNASTGVAPGPFTLKKRGCTGTSPTATTGVLAEKRQFISNMYYIRNYAVAAGDGIPTLMRAQFDLDGGTPAFKAAEPLINGIEGFRVEFGIDNISETGVNVISDATPANRYDAPLSWTDPATQRTMANRGDGSPDGAYVRCTAAAPCTPAQLANVVAVKIHVLARTEEATSGYIDTKTYHLGSTTLGPFRDRFKRHVFSTTVRLTNMSGRRETP